jgi:hypothetical protein
MGLEQFQRLNVMNPVIVDGALKMLRTVKPFALNVAEVNNNIGQYMFHDNEPIIATKVPSDLA